MAVLRCQICREKCVENKEITWVNIVSEEEGKRGWDAPMADYYGVSGIPTAIRVDQKGKVEGKGSIREGRPLVRQNKVERRQAPTQPAELLMEMLHSVGV